MDVILGLSQEKNINLYVSGSNSKRLLSDIVTEFMDKVINIQLVPPLFEELNSYIQGSSIKNLYEYMQFGGMSFAVLKKEEDKCDYLKSLFKTAYFRNIISGIS